jgi:hypothetical protein
MYFNLRKSKYCSKLPWYFYNIDQKYHGILTLEKGGTTVNYRHIFITLCPGLNALFVLAVTGLVEVHFLLTNMP